MCNGHLPTNSIYTRFLWVIRFLVRNHFYVVLDNQLNIDSTALDDPVRWVGLWEQLLTDVVADPVSKARVMVDILNEPDSRDLQCAPLPAPPCPLCWPLPPQLPGQPGAPWLCLGSPLCWAPPHQSSSGGAPLGCARATRAAGCDPCTLARQRAPQSAPVPTRSAWQSCLDACQRCKEALKHENLCSLAAGGRGARRPRRT